MSNLSPELAAAIERAYYFLAGTRLEFPESTTLDDLLTMDEAEKMNDLQRGVNPDITYFDYAKYMVGAREYLPFNKLQDAADGNWGDQPPFDEDTIKAIQKGAGNLLKLINWGFQNGEWWNLEKIWPDVTQRVDAVFSMLDTCRLYKYLADHNYKGFYNLEFIPPMLVEGINVPRAYKMLEAADSGLVLMTELYAHWDLQFRKNLLRRKKQAEEEELHPCINPFCDKGENGQPSLLPAHKTYCCKECRSYRCDHPDCIRKAEQNHWGFMRHAWDTPKGRDHQAYRRIGE